MSRKQIHPKQADDPRPTAEYAFQLFRSLSRIAPPEERISA